MSLKDRLAKDLQEALRSGDELRKSVLRMARAAIKNAEMARSAEILDMITRNDPKAQGELYDAIRRHRQLASEHEASGNSALAEKERMQVAAIVARMTELDDAGVQDVLRKEIKQRHEAAEQYRRGNRPDLADKELAEAAILEAYLPQRMSEQEIEAEVRAIISEVGASGPKDMGKVMSVAIARMRDRADGRAINQVVTRLLSQGAR
jgi:uncharacterized protein YqeY